MIRVGVLGLLCLATIMALGGCKKVDDTDPAHRVVSAKNKTEVRFRVTVEVDDNGTIRSGSSVWSWTLSKPTLALASPYNGKFKGEAVAVELSDGRVLFALLRGSGANTNLSMLAERQFREFWVDGKMDDRVANLRSIAKNVGQSKTLACEQWQDGDERDRSDFAFDCPMLVTFVDTADPKSIVSIAPYDLSSVLGESVALSQISIQITDQPVTKGLYKRLIWLDSHVGSLVKRPQDIPIGKMPAEHRLTEIDFRRGENE